MKRNTDQLRKLLTILLVASFYCQAGANCVTLTWTASGDDNNAGTANRYDLRYSKQFISRSNWDLATKVTLVTSPRPAGSVESLNICGLEYGTTFYFALKAGDESGNWSNVSNIAIATTPIRPTDRGDVNLNGVIFESGDIVVFMNYFLQGLSAFNVDLQEQIAQTDINNDGIMLTVSDLVDLISIVVDGSDPFTKPSLSIGTIKITLDQRSPRATVGLDSPGEIAAAYLVFEMDQPQVAIEPLLTVQSNHMSMSYALQGNRLVVLIYSLGGESIKSGNTALLHLKLENATRLKLIYSEVVSPEAATYKSEIQTGRLPKDHSLSPNYPNPFNPVTRINFSLGRAEHVSIHVYNILGEIVVTLLDQPLEAGDHFVMWDSRDNKSQPVASGIYFYRLRAGEFVETRKMMLLK